MSQCISPHSSLLNSFSPTPTTASSLTDGGVDGNNNNNIFDRLNGARGITTVQIDSSIYSLVASETDDGIQIIRIAENQPVPVATPENPIPVSSITDGSTFDQLDGSFGITTVKIGASTYALVASITDDGIQIINISNPAAPTVASSVTNGGTFDELDGASGITTVQIDSSIYAIATASNDDGIQIIRIAEN